MMKILLLIFLSFIIFINTTLLNAQSSKSYTIKKIGPLKSTAQLDSLYSADGQPILIVNDIVYILPKTCIEGRDFGSGNETKNNKSDLEQKDNGSGKDLKSYDSKNETKKTSANNERKKQANDQEHRTKGSAAESRNKANQNESRNSGQGKDDRESDRDTDVRKSGNGDVSKNFSSSAEGRQSNTYTLQIKCSKCEKGFEIIDMLGKTDNIYVYDGVSKVRVDGMRYTWE